MMKCYYTGDVLQRLSVAYLEIKGTRCTFIFVTLNINTKSFFSPRKGGRRKPQPHMPLVTICRPVQKVVVYTYRQHCITD